MLLSELFPLLVFVLLVDVLFLLLEAGVISLLLFIIFLVRQLLSAFFLSLLIILFLIFRSLLNVLFGPDLAYIGTLQVFLSFIMLYF